MTPADNAPQPSLESAMAAEITAVIEAVSGIARVVHARVVTADAETVVGAKVAIERDQMLGDVSEVLARARSRVTDLVTGAVSIYLEPVLQAHPTGDAPPTDVFILKSAN